MIRSNMSATREETKPPSFTIAFETELEKDIRNAPDSPNKVTTVLCLKCFEHSLKKIVNVKL